MLEQQNGDSHHDDSHERTGYLAAQARHEGYDGNARQPYDGAPQVDGAKVMGIGYPFLYEIRGHLRHVHAEQVLDLRGEDGDCDAAREANDDGIRYVFDDGAEPQHA